VNDGVDFTAGVGQGTCRWCGSVDDGSAALCPSCEQVSSPRLLVPAQPAAEPAPVTQPPVSSADTVITAGAPAARPADDTTVRVPPPGFGDAAPPGFGGEVPTVAAGAGPSSVATGGHAGYGQQTGCAGYGQQTGYAGYGQSSSAGVDVDHAPAASFGARLAARLIDAVVPTVVGLVPVLVVLKVVIGRYTNAFDSAQLTSDGTIAVSTGLIVALVVLYVAPLIAYLVYRLGSDGGSGRSVGRAAMGIRLVAVDPAGAVRGGRVGFRRALGRLIVSGVTDWLFFLGSLSMLWNTEGRTWADLASGTRVVRDRTQRPGPGRALAAAVVAAAVVTGGAAFAGVEARDSVDRQLAQAAFATGGDGRTSSSSPSVADPSTSPNTTPIDPTYTDPNATPTDSAGTDPSLTDPNATPTGSPSPTDSASSSQAGSVQVDTTDTLSQAIASSLDTYFSGINNQNYSVAWSQLSTNQQNQIGTFDQFSQQLSTSSNSAIELHDTAENGDGTYNADVTFTSHQGASFGPNPGETCTNWTLTYRLVSDGGSGYLIDGVPTASHNAC
jgi:uncharacterized RDD family membrane protein YckC